jgi:PKD repeat protein
MFRIVCCWIFSLGFFAQAMAVSSRFSRSTECWTVTGDGTGPNLKSTGGNPGGYAEAYDLNIRQTWYWSAPRQFLGNKATSIGQNLSFDIRTNYPGAARGTRQVFLEGAGLTIGATMPNLPGTSWTHNDIPLLASNWHYSSNDALVSVADFLAVMSNLTGIRILGEYSNEADTGGLDNVVMAPESQMESQVQPCNGLCLAFFSQVTSNPVLYSWSFPGALTPVANTAQVPAVCYPQPGTYSVQLIASNACFSDTLRQTLQVTGSQPREVQAWICEGGSYQLPGGQTVSVAGTYIDSLKTAAGCDSIIRTLLKTKFPKTDSLQKSLCFGETYQLGDTTLRSSGRYVRLLQTAEGCDSTVVLDLRVFPKLEGIRHFTLCVGESVQDGDTTYTTAGIFVRKLKSRGSGCDSLHTTVVERIELNLQAWGDTVVEPDALVSLRAFSSSQHVAYFWTGELQPECSRCPEAEVRVPHSMDFQIQILDTLHQCALSRMVRVTVRCPIDIPNLVTLNRDGLNDYFYLQNQSCLRQIRELDVYDRWGKKVFHRDGYPEGYEHAAWQPTMPGTYFYRLEVDVYETEYPVYTGWIHVIADRIE